MSFKEYLNKTEEIVEAEENVKYTTVMFGGSIGDQPIRSLIVLKGKTADDKNIFDDKADAQAKAKRMNKILSPGEKKFYKLSYKVAEVVDGVFTGK